MLDAAEVKRLDLNSAWHGVPPSLLMQNAGAAVAEAASQRFKPRRVLVLAGHGNNGGDGAVAARLLSQRGIAVTVFYAADPETIKSGEARAAYAALDRRKVRIETYRSPERVRELARDADIVIDALLGVGVSGNLRAPLDAIVRAANSSRRPILAIDVPTGIGGRLQIRPDATVTLHDRKRGMTPASCGSILVRPIGIPPAAIEVGPGDLAVHYRTHDPQSHKGMNGRVLVVAGGPYCGAPLLGAMAALRTGADIVRLYTPDECAKAARAHAPDLIVHAGIDDDRLLPQDLERIEPLLKKADVVLAGPGLGLHRATQGAVARLLDATQKARLPLVLDADAQVVAGKNPRLLRRRPVICTPHAREFFDLTRKKLPKDERRCAATARREAKRLGITLLVKGPVDLVTDGRRTRPNRIHHPWMTAGGTGDVLAGVTAALLSRGLEPFDAAGAASFLTGAAGLRAFESHSWGARATDLVEQIPNVLRDWIR